MESSSEKFSTLSIIIPCYNEAATIAEVVAKVAAAPLPSGWGREIIVVDDGSGDETRAALEGLDEKEFSAPVRVVYRGKNGGKGAAVKDGLRLAAGDYCVIQDADLEVDPIQYTDLLQPILTGEAQATFAYRVLAAPGAPKNTVLFYGGKLVSSLFNIAFGTRLRDIPCCYKLFPRRCIPALLEAPSENFVFDAIEMTYVINRECSVVQVPVTYRPRSRAQGKKIRIRHGLQCVIAIVLLRTGFRRRVLDPGLSRLVRYLFTGLITVACNLGALFVLTEWTHLYYLASSVGAFVFSYCVNFSLHKFWTFRSPDIKKISRQLPLHLSLALINLVFNTLLVYLGVEYLHLSYLVAQAAAMAIIAGESFFLLSRVVFNG